MMRRGGIILTILLALAAFSAGAAYRIYSLVNADVAEIKESIRFDEQQGTLNVLVLGIDELEAVHRSDTIILARIDIDTKKASVMSIPRDTRVAIRGHKGQQKLNHAYAYGGIELLRETVVNLTGVPVNYYLILNYASFPKIVDAVGGVDITIAKRMKYTDKAQGLYIDFAPGKRHMNGADGLKYVRFRMDAMGDMGRMKRQQEFASAFIDKVTSPAILPRLPELVELVLSEIKTDIPMKTALQLAGQLKDMRLSDVRFFTMPGDPAYISGISYFVPDLEKASREMDPNLGTASDAGAAENAPTDTKADTSDTKKTEEAPVRVSDEELAALVANFKTPITVLNGTGKTGLAKQFTTLFEKAGIEVEFTGNAKHSGYEYCIIQYSDENYRSLAKELARLCGISESLARKGNTSHRVSIILGKKNYQSVMNRLRSLSGGQ